MQFPSRQAADNNTGIQEQNFQINASAHAFRILSDSLYQDKERAVIRELACNALDAHVAAGIPDTPIKITLPDELNPMLEVQDFGKGMSRSTLEKLYTTYFESTKQESDDDIGGFGLGSKSPFAITDNFTVTSVTSTGESTTILAYLDNGIPKVMVTGHAEKTNFPQGTCVTVSVPEERIEDLIHVISSAENGLFDYWQTFPEVRCKLGGEDVNSALDKARQRNIETRSIPKTKLNTDVYLTLESNFLSSDSFRNLKVVYGNIQYNIPKKLVDKLQFNKHFLNYRQCVIHLPLKTIIELSPGREHIEDSKHNIQILESILGEIDHLITRYFDRLCVRYGIKMLRLFKSNASIENKYQAALKIRESFKLSTEKERYTRLLPLFNSLLPHRTNIVGMLYSFEHLVATNIFGKDYEKYVNTGSYWSDNRNNKYGSIEGDNLDFRIHRNRSDYHFKNKDQNFVVKNINTTFFNQFNKIYLVRLYLSDRYESSVQEFINHIKKTESNSCVITFGYGAERNTLENFIDRFANSIDVHNPEQYIVVDKPYINKALNIIKAKKSYDRNKGPTKLGYCIYGDGVYELNSKNIKEFENETFHNISEIHTAHQRSLVKNISEIHDVKFLYLTCKNPSKNTQYFKNFLNKNNVIEHDFTNLSELGLHFISQISAVQSYCKLYYFIDSTLCAPHRFNIDNFLKYFLNKKLYKNYLRNKKYTKNILSEYGLSGYSKEYLPNHIKNMGKVKEYYTECLDWFSLIQYSIDPTVNKFINKKAFYTQLHSLAKELEVIK